MRVKIFTATNPFALEESVNHWLEEQIKVAHQHNDYLLVLGIRYAIATSVDASIFSALVQFKITKRRDEEETNSKKRTFGPKMDKMQ